jgi:pimeloyl-ACP methyl ester carboxylesterase
MMQKQTIIIPLLSFILGSCLMTPVKKIDTPFPVPLGSFTVGTETLLFTRLQNTDTTKVERPISVQIWYPNAQNKISRPAPYILDSNLVKAFKEDEYLNLNDTVITGWSTLNTHAALESPIHGPENGYPLLIFSHGFGMSKTNYTLLSMELASQGYIVAALDHLGSGLTILPNGSAIGMVPNEEGPDGKVIEFCEDFSLAISSILKLKKFKGAINTKAIGVIGHSLGGAAALNFAEYDQRIKATVNLDGYLFGGAMKVGVKSPFLSILQSPNFEGKSVPDSLKYQRENEWKSIIEKSNAESYVVSVKGLMHFDFSDLPYIIPDSVRLKNGGTLPAPESHRILSALIVAFFDSYLKKDDKTSVIELIQAYEEVDIVVD